MEKRVPRKSVSSTLREIRQKAKTEKKYRFRSLYALINEELLHQCFHKLNKKSATGVDGVSYNEYKENLDSNIQSLVMRLKEKRYRAKLVRRKYIPKENGKRRPLSIPCLEDKLVQQAARTILESIYESDFLDCSKGYRPEKGPQETVKELQHELFAVKRCNWIVEADIKSFFDQIDHDWLTKMLEHRIDDNAMIRLIRKWLRAGILEEDGQVVHPVTGSPQGGIISPLLANIYLHYVLDLWVQREGKNSRGDMVYMRYADDWITGFQCRDDAERYYRELPLRLKKFGLEVSEDKTNIIKFSRSHLKESKKFTFLGFDFLWSETRNGKTTVKRRTNKNKFRQSLRNLKEWIKENRNKRIGALAVTLRSKFQGYWNYYGVIGNSEMLAKYWYLAQQIIYKWLNRRSQRASYNWKSFNDMWKGLNIPPPRIVERPWKQEKQQLLTGIA